MSEQIEKLEAGKNEQNAEGQNAETAQPKEKKLSMKDLQEQNESLANELADLKAMIKGLTETIAIKKEDSKANMDAIQEANSAPSIGDDENELVPFRAPITREEHDDITLGLCGVNYKIRRGVTVQLPRALMALIENQERQNMASIDMLQATKDEYVETAKKYGVDI